MTDSRTRMFARFSSYRKRREMLRRMRILLKEMGKYDNTKREASKALPGRFSWQSADLVLQSQGRYIITDVYYFNDECFVKLNSGCGGFGMGFLVNNGYEYFDGKNWKPFGVEE